MEPLVYALLSVAGALLALALLLLGRLARQIMSLPVRRGTVTLRARKDLPADLLPTFLAVEAQLRALGFEHSHCEEASSPFRLTETPLWIWDFVHLGARCTASVVNSELPDRYFPCHVSFASRFDDDSLLLTVNAREQQYLPGVPGLEVVDAWSPDLAGQWQAHQASVARRAGSAGPPLPPLPPAAALAAHQRLLDATVKHLRDARWVKPWTTDQDRFRFAAALRFARRLTRGERRLATLRRRMARTHGPALPISADDEVSSYRRLETLAGGSPIGWVWKTALFLASVVLFGLAFGLSLEAHTVLILIGALLLHELGHVLAMRRFGYRNLQVLFLPFLGAIALASERGVRAHQRVIVYLLGPLPGLALGHGLLLSSAAEQPLVRETAVVLIVLNYFNLLPLMPLDGGQVLNVVLFERFPRAQAVFTWLSASALAALAWTLTTPVLIVLAALLVLVGAVQRRQAGLLRRLGAAVGSPPEEETRLRRAFALLREPPHDRLPFAQKFPLAKALVERMGQAPASLPVAAASLASYTAALVLPLLLLGPGAFLQPAVEPMPDWETRAAAALSDEARWQVYLEAGDWFSEREDDEAARAYYERAVPLAEEFGENDARLAESLVRQASYAEDNDRARAIYERALAIRERALGPDHPEVAATLESLAWTYGLRDEARAEGIALRLRALDIRRRAQGERSPAVAESLRYLAMAYEARADLGPAEASLRESLEILRSAPGADDWERELALTTITEFYLRHARYADAEQTLLQALDSEGSGTERYRRMDRARRENSLGWARLLQGDGEGARHWFEAAVRDHERACCNRCRDLALVPLLLDLAYAQGERQDADGARASVERAAVILQGSGETLPDHAARLERYAQTRGETHGWPALRHHAQAKAIRLALRAPDGPP